MTIQTSHPTFLGVHTGTATAGVRSFLPAHNLTQLIVFIRFSGGGAFPLIAFPYLYCLTKIPPSNLHHVASLLINFFHLSFPHSFHSSKTFSLAGSVPAWQPLEEQPAYFFVFTDNANFEHICLVDSRLIVLTQATRNGVDNTSKGADKWLSLSTYHTTAYVHIEEG